MLVLGEDEEIRQLPTVVGWTGIETAWLDRSCGKNKMILDGEEHRKLITEYRKPKPVTQDGGEHRKPITEYRKPSDRTDNLRSSRNC